MGRGGDVVIRGGDGGGDVTVRAGDGTHNADGGSVNIRAGDGGTSIPSTSNRPSNPLLAGPSIQPYLKPLFDALINVSICSISLARCYPRLVSLRDSRGKPKPEDWPDSPAFERDRARHTQGAEATRAEFAMRGEAAYVAGFLESEWTEAMREWSDWYKKWCIALTNAKQEVNVPAVAAIMNEGEARPMHRWTTQTTIDLNNLAGTLHPIDMGGDDGLGFIRCGLPPFPAEFDSCALAIDTRIAELRAIPGLPFVVGASPDSLAIGPTPLTGIQPAASSAPLGGPALGDDLGGNDACIVQALREAGRRLTGPVLLNKALGGADSHGKAILASLVKRKVITNKRDADPPGYGLPEWL